MFRANVYGRLDEGIVILQFRCWNFSQKKLCSGLCLIEVEYYFKKANNRFLIHPLGDLRVRYALRTPSIARWKARGRLHIRHNLTFFAISYR